MLTATLLWTIIVDTISYFNDISLQIIFLRGGNDAVPNVYTGWGLHGY